MCAPRARARPISSSTRMAGAFADVHAGAAAIERPARLRIHQPQRVEPAEGQPRERVGAAGQRRVEPAGADGIGGLADRDGARRAGRDDARAQSFEPEVAGDEVDRGAREVVPGIRRARELRCRARASRGRSLRCAAGRWCPRRAARRSGSARSPPAARHRPRLRARRRRRTDRRATSGGAGAASAAPRSARSRLRRRPGCDSRRRRTP